MTQGDFQSQVNVAQAPFAEGDFIDANPRTSYDAGPGGLVAGASGVIIGRFAWATAPLDGDGAPATVSNSGPGLPSGFVHREQQGLITTYLASSGMLIQPGFGLTLMTSGGYAVKNAGSSEATYGQKAYASNADGSVIFAATGQSLGGGTSTASTIAAKTASITAYIAGNVLNVTAASGDPIVNGALIDTGTGVAAGTQIVKQLTGTTGGIGTYLLNIGEQTVASESMTFTYGLLTVGGTVAGTFGLNQLLSGSGLTAGSYITGLGTGTGGAGTYYVNNTQTISSQAINSIGYTETKYYARSTGLPGELVKISSTSNA